LKSLRGLDASEAYAAVRSTWKGWPVMGGVAQGSKVYNWGHLLGLDPPCTVSSEAEIWLNDPAVRRAIHAAPIKLTTPWVICSDRIDYTHDMGSMIPYHQKLTQEKGLRALIYSGDHDLCVPHTGSEAWTSGLGFNVKTPWQPWYVKDEGYKQVAGYYVEYESGLTYATVKGAGHMVPQMRPEEALELFKRFVDGGSLEL